MWCFSRSYIIIIIIIEQEQQQAEISRDICFLLILSFLSGRL